MRVMMENYRTLSSLGCVLVKPDVISKIERAMEPCLDGVQGLQDISTDAGRVKPEVISNIKGKLKTEPWSPGQETIESQSPEPITVKHEAVTWVREEKQAIVRISLQAQRKASGVYVVPDITARIKQENEPMGDPRQDGEEDTTDPEIILTIEDEDEPCVIDEIKPKEEELLTDISWTECRNQKNIQPGLAIRSSDSCDDDLVIEDIANPTECDKSQESSKERVVNVWFVKRLAGKDHNVDEGSDLSGPPYVKESKDVNNSILKLVDNYRDCERKPDVDDLDSSVDQENADVSDFIYNQTSLDQKTFSCSECGEHFPDKSLLETHLITHMEDTVRVCPVCTQCFPTEFDLKNHLKAHKEKTSWPCSECGKCLYTKSSLDRHMLIHIRDKPIPCPKCGKLFTKHSNYEMHLRLHDGEVFYPCTQCEKLFSSKAACDRHIRAHTMERPHACPQCGKRFMYNGCLIRHLRTHTGERPFACPECGRHFRQTSALSRHLKMHMAEKSGEFPKSDKSFTQQDEEGQQESDGDDQPFVQYISDDENSSPTYVIL